MAGEPAWSLATAALPPDFPQADAAAIVDHLNRFAAQWGCPVIGGDVGTTEPGAPAVLTVTVAGRPHAARGPVLRSTARPGDHCWMTGRLGGSFPSGRHLTFEPRVREARWLADLLGPDLHAMIDLSDGLGRDAARVAQASGVRVRLESAHFPLHPPSGAGPGAAAGPDAREAAADGEDYELFFTAAAGAALPRACPVTGTPLTRIGLVLPVAQGGAWSCVIADADGREWDCAALGWEH
jgi:thiamine-monophosphate kinase